MKYLAKVIDINPTKRVLKAKTFNGKVFSGVNIIKNGQTVPSIGDMVIIDDSLISSEIPMYICVGSVDFGPSTDEGFEDQPYSSSDIQYSGESFAPSYEKDWQHYNPIFNSFIGTAGTVTAIINDIVSLILDSSTSKTELSSGEISVRTNNYELKMDDSATGIPVFRFSGKLGSGIIDENFVLEITPNNPNYFLLLSITSAQYGDFVNISIDHSGKLSIKNKSGLDLISDSFIASLSSAAIDVSSEISLKTNSIKVMASEVVLSIVGSLMVSVLGKINISSQDAVNMSASEINLISSGDPITASPMSKKITIKSSNGSVLILTPMIETNPVANSGVLISSGFDDNVVKNLPSIVKGIGIFARDPGGIVLGGPLPSPIGINSFVKFNEFSILMSTLIGSLIAFATTQASVSASGPLAPLAPGFTALAAAAASALTMILPCKSIMVTTAEP